MMGVTQGGIEIELPGRRRRSPEPITNAEASRMRVALARVLAAAGYTARDRAKILCVPKSTLHDWERRTPEVETPEEHG